MHVTYQEANHRSDGRVPTEYNRADGNNNCDECANTVANCNDVCGLEVSIVALRRRKWDTCRQKDCERHYSVLSHAADSATCKLRTRSFCWFSQPKCSSHLSLMPRSSYRRMISPLDLACVPISSSISW